MINDSKVIKDVYVLYDIVAENIALIMLTDTDKIACRQAFDFCLSRRYSYKEFKLYKIGEIDSQSLKSLSLEEFEEVPVFYDVCEQIVKLAKS